MGNVTLAREDARAAWIAPWLDSVWQDGMYALRMFRRAPVFTGAFVLVMALGVGATTAVFALVDGLVLRDLPVNRPDRLVYFSAPSFSYPIFTEVKARSTEVLASVAAWSVEDEYVAWTQQLEPSEVLTASGGFYDTLGVTAAVGRTFSDADDRIGGGPEGRVAVISYSAWQRRYGGDPGVVGRTVRVGPDTYTIVGVTPRRVLRRGAWCCAGDHHSADQQRQAVVAAVGDLELGAPDRPPARRCVARRGQHGAAAVLAGRAGGRRRNEGGGGQARVVPRTQDFDRVGAGRLLAGPQPVRQALVVPLRPGRAAARRRRGERRQPAARARRRAAAGDRRASGHRRRPGQAGAADADRVDGPDVDRRGRRAADRQVGRRRAAGVDDHARSGHRAGCRHQRPHRDVLSRTGRGHLGALLGDSRVSCHARGSGVRAQGRDRDLARVRKRSGVRTGRLSPHRSRSPCCCSPVRRCSYAA